MLVYILYCFVRGNPSDEGDKLLVLISGVPKRSVTARTGPVQGTILTNTEVFMCHLNKPLLVDYVISIDQILTRYPKSGHELGAELLETCLVGSCSLLATPLPQVPTYVNQITDWIGCSKYSHVLAKGTAASQLHG